MLNTELAVVGIDSQFDQYKNIDQVARALYLGRKYLESKHLSKQHLSGQSSKKNSEQLSDKKSGQFSEQYSEIIIDTVNRLYQPLSPTLSVDKSRSNSTVNIIIVDDNSYKSSDENSDQNTQQADTSLIENLEENLKEKISHTLKINKLHCVSQLSEAITLINQFAEANEIVALIGIKLDNVTDVELEKAQAASQQKEHTSTISFDESFSGYQTQQGYASLLLVNKAQAQSLSLPCYGNIKAVEGFVSGLSSSNNSSSKANSDTKAGSELQSDNAQSQIVNAIKLAHNTLAQTQADTDDNGERETIGLVEVSALTDKTLCDLESSALTQAYRGGDKTAAISCVKDIVGEAGGFGQVLSLLRSIMCVQQRFIAGIDAWQKPNNHLLEKWQQSSFYFPLQARPWFNKNKRRAAYSCLTKDSYCHFIIEENSSQLEVRENGFLANSEFNLLLFCADDEAQLQAQLAQQLTYINEIIDKNSLLVDQIAQCSANLADLKSMAGQQYKKYQQHLVKQSAKQRSTRQYTLVLLAESLSQLTEEIKLAQSGISKSFIAQQQNDGQLAQWKTPRGSCFTSMPAGNPASNSASNQVNDNVSFMYPGIGATYLGLGQDLLQLFPNIYPAVATLTNDIAFSLKDKLLNTRSLARLDFNELKTHDLKLRAKLADIAEAGVSYACIFTQIFQQVFNLNAKYACGYSMGEVSMFAALGCWQNPGQMSERLNHSVSFNEELSGPLNSLRRQWPEKIKLAHSQNQSQDQRQQLWETYAIKATQAEIEPLIANNPYVFCTIINSPDNLLIAGFPDDCLRVAEQLGVRAISLNMANAIHCEPAKSQYDAMVKLYSMAVNERIDTKLYSSSCYLPVPQVSSAIANSIAKCLCERVDFPRLINAMYEKGARIFIEMGAGRSLSTWVEKILLQQQNNAQASPSITVPINAKGVSDEVSYFRAIAKLLSHGVQLNLNPLFNGTMIINQNEK